VYIVALKIQKCLPLSPLPSHTTFCTAAKSNTLNFISVSLNPSFRYPACNWHLLFAILYCHLWPLCFYHIFPHYFKNGTIFDKYLLDIKCVFWCSLQLPPEKFLNLRRSQRDAVATLHSCQIFNEFEVFYFLEKQTNTTFHVKPSSVYRALPYGQTDGRKDGGRDRHGEADSCYWKFCEGA
jgi:hypothetical protein